MIPYHTQAWFGSLDDTPIGPVALAASANGLVRISLFGMDGMRRAPEFAPQTLSAGAQGAPPAFLAEGLRQLDEYFCCRRKVFDLPFDLEGYTPFTMQILALCKAIPYGQTRTYGSLAGELGRPGTARFVGNCMARNPLPLVIPCHRMLGSDGRLHGFGAPGGLATKAWLLKMESGL
jgi:methylated-DNA-[protein]-cysteine S-methyltransferase